MRLNIMELNKYKKYKEGMAFYTSLVNKGYSPDSKDMTDLLTTIKAIKS